MSECCSTDGQLQTVATPCNDSGG